MCDTATIQARIRQKSRASQNTAERSVSGALEAKPEVEIWRRPVFLTQRPRLSICPKVGQSTQLLPVLPIHFRFDHDDFLHAFFSNYGHFHDISGHFGHFCSHPPGAAAYFMLLLCVWLKLFWCRFVPPSSQILATPLHQEVTFSYYADLTIASDR